MRWHHGTDCKAGANLPTCTRPAAACPALSFSSLLYPSLPFPSPLLARPVAARARLGVPVASLPP